MKLTWDDIYIRADGKGFGSDELEAKDNARYEVQQFVIEKENYDLETAEIPEEEVDYYCDKYDIFFDGRGHIIERS